MELLDAYQRARLVAGTIALDLELPVEAGYDFFDGCVDDDVLGWDRQTYLGWCHLMDIKYMQYGIGEKFNELYTRVSHTMGEYGNLITLSPKEQDGGGRDDEP